MTTMRCLSIRQPWAWAICLGEKSVENRTWSTDYREQIAVHTSSSRQDAKRALKNSRFGAHDCVFGAVIGVAEVVDCVPLINELHDDPWALGPICWRLANARFISEPMPLKGKLNLFELPADVADQVERQIGQPAGLPENAEEVVAAIRPNDCDRLLAQARSYFDLGNSDADVSRCNDALAIESRWEAHQLRSVGYLGLGKHEAALADADQAISVEPKAAAAFLVRATAKLHLGLDGVREDFEKAGELGLRLPSFEEWMEGRGDRS